MTRAIIVGAGGQGLVVADALDAAHRLGADLKAVAFVDDNPALAATTILNLSVVGGTDGLRLTPHDAIVVAVGDNATRDLLTTALESVGERIVSAVHPSAVVSAHATIERGVMISAGAVVVAGARIGRGALINTRCSVDHQSDVGAFAHIGPGAVVGANVRIGERTLVGTGATVMSGVSVGVGAIIGAGAVVTHDIPGGVVAMGVPARITRDVR